MPFRHTRSTPTYKGNTLSAQVDLYSNLSRTLLERLMPSAQPTAKATKITAVWGEFTKQQKPVFVGWVESGTAKHTQFIASDLCVEVVW